MVEPERVRFLKPGEPKAGDYVLYWMQQAVRSVDNHALEYAALTANALDLPLVVLFGLTDAYPEANERHFAFLLEGLADVHRALRRRGVLLTLQHESPETAALRFARRAALTVVDRGYLRIQRRWREFLAERSPCPVVQIESDVVVPVETASPKEEFAARTLRPKIQKLTPAFLKPVETVRLKHDSTGMKFGGLNPADVDGVLAAMSIDRSVKRVDGLVGGETVAAAHLKTFLEVKFAGYADGRNQPARAATSQLSPYLHFGQLSPITAALAARKAVGPAAAKESFLEELIVRRELSMNFVYYNDRYDEYDGLPEWSRKSLEEHAADPRDPSYSYADLDEAKTHDVYWNAAQREMTLTGYMHNYMRMYWGKKILEWAPTPREAFQWALKL
ncbi:MAG: deoxyribodipyrimidine photo-lyase, partial [Planctomycetia bacterium]